MPRGGKELVRATVTIVFIDLIRNIPFSAPVGLNNVYSLRITVPAVPI